MSRAHLEKIQASIRACRACPRMEGTPVHGAAIEARILLVGQAPGPHEAKLGRPFAYTAGRTLFKWFARAGVTEEEFRARVYMAAVARCFPGKATKGAGDREPDAAEIANCRRHLAREVEALAPELILAVGRLAITEVLGPERFTKKNTLADVVGTRLRATFHGRDVDVIALPHPSGVSSWPNTEPGKTKLARALALLEKHPAWRGSFFPPSRV